MTWVMPIVFAWFFLASAPSGLVLYWMTLNLVNVVVQLVINKMLPQEPAEPPLLGRQVVPRHPHRAGAPLQGGQGDVHELHGWPPASVRSSSVWSDTEVNEAGPVEIRANRKNGADFEAPLLSLRRSRPPG